MVRVKTFQTQKIRREYYFYLERLELHPLGRLWLNYADCNEESDWDCTLWEDFGTGFAYVQSGQPSYSINGTTLALSRPGSGIREILRPCLQEFMQTKEYHEICQKYDITNQCFPNKYFSEEDVARNPYQLETNEQTGDCSDGFCSCDIRAHDSVELSLESS